MDDNQPRPNSQQPNQNVSQSETPAQPLPEPQPAQSPQPPAKKSKLRLVVLAAILLLGAGAAYYTLVIQKKDNTTDPAGSQLSDQQLNNKDVALKTTSYESGLEHKTTVSFEHPADWAVTQGETPIEGYSLKRLTIASPEGHYLHVSDMDGKGGNCDPDTGTYTLTKRLGTKTNGMVFKEYDVPTSENQSNILILENEGREWSVPAHDALSEGQSLTNTCNISGYSSIGSSGVFVGVYNSADDTSLENRLGWNDIKDDDAFVRMLESMVAVDKSPN